MPASLASTAQYSDITTLKLRIGQTASGDDDLLDLALSWASRWIDDYCHRVFASVTMVRYFGRADLYGDNERLLLDSRPSQQFPDPLRVLTVDEDLLTVTQLLNGDGTEITTGNYWLAPRNESPYYMIRLKTPNVWYLPIDGWIEVHGTWGYSASPDSKIEGCCLQLAEYHYRSRKLVEQVPLETPSGQMIPRQPKVYAFPTQVYQDLEGKVKINR